jgi:ATP-dependent DNA helicase RecG
LKESQTIELKESWRDEYLRTIAAFANTDGGTMLIGYDDKGRLKGIKNSDKLLEDLPNKIINTLGITASIVLQKAEEKSVIIIQVEKSKNPVSFQSRFYVRSGSTTQELKGAALQSHILRANNMTWDEVTMPESDFDDIDRETVARFVKRAVDYNRLPATTDAGNLPLLFENLNLTDNRGELTRAALLLFGKRTQRWFLQARFKIGRFNGNNPTALMLHDMVEGNLFEMPDKIMDLLKAKYLLSPIHYEGLQRVEALEIPEKAMREAVLNAVIHRDYASTSNIDLRIFDDTISLWNHGGLPPQLDIEKLKNIHASYPRNKLIANVFYRAGYIEAWGRGTLTIIKEVVAHRLPLPTFTNDGAFTITFYRQQVQVQPVKFKYPSDKISDIQWKIVEMMNENGKITIPEIMEQLHISEKTTNKHIAVLKELAIIERNGGRKNGIWTVTHESIKRGEERGEERGESHGRHIV